MPISDKQRQDIENRFGYHAPKGDQTARYGKITDAYQAFALVIADLTPESREQSIALTHLWESRMAANASIAINE